MKKILLVCTGNTCRSSMAEVILKKLIHENKDGAGDLEVRSAGTYALEGDKASSNAIIVVRELGLSLEEHRATPLTQELVEEADLVLTMTMGHKRTILQAMPEVEDKVFTLKEYVHKGTEEKERVCNFDISDPFGQSVEVYKSCADEIILYLSRLLDRIEKDNKK